MESRRRPVLLFPAAGLENTLRLLRPLGVALLVHHLDVNDRRIPLRLVKMVTHSTRKERKQRKEGSQRLVLEGERRENEIPKPICMILQSLLEIP